MTIYFIFEKRKKGEMFMKKFLGLFLTLALVLVLAACGKKNDEKVLVVGYDDFSEKFSPFFASTAYDQDVVGMTSIGLMTTDRDGGIIYNSINGETVKRGANSHTYTGITDLKTEIDSNGNTTYTIKLKEGVKFSDGEELTADDVIFSYYVYLDPNYTGSTTLSSVDIVGLKNYLENNSNADVADRLAPKLVAAIDSETGVNTDGLSDQLKGYTDYAAKVTALETKVKEFIVALLKEEAKWIKDDVFTKDAYAGYRRAVEDGVGVKFDAKKHEVNDSSVAATLAYLYAIQPEYTYFNEDGTAKAEADVLAEISAQTGKPVGLLEATLEWVKSDVLTDDDYTKNWRLLDENGEVVVYDAENEDHEEADVNALATLVTFFTSKLQGPEFSFVKDDAAKTAKTLDEVVNEIAAQYGLNYKALDSAYGASVVAPKVTDAAFDIALTIVDSFGAGSAVPNITGITKVDDYTVKVKVNGFDAAAIYQVCGITVGPMHYYGDETKYDYAANKFGFNNRATNSMELIEAKTATPMGAGPYKFVKFENNVVYFEANEHYYRGVPKTKHVRFQVVDEANKVSGILTGDLDISNPTASKEKFDEINAESTKILAQSVDNLGYGYIGLNAFNIQVGNTEESINSDESKALRKAFATVFAAYRYTAIPSYYGDMGSVIEYPISNTSWAAPKAGAEDFEYAFSTNAAGDYIYGNKTPGEVGNSERMAAAKLAAKSWFTAAGYTFVEKAGTAEYGDKLYTATAPAGAKLEYEIIIPAGGGGDHPAYALGVEAQTLLAELGITLEINDPSDTNVLWDAIDANTVQMWAAAWGSTIDPDMYQVYHSSNINGDNAPAGSTGSNNYYLRSDALDKLIVDARKSLDQAERKVKYKDALDLILDLGVEVPTYQRQNVFAISKERVDVDSLTPDITTYWSWMAEIEKLEMK
jgi:peptide/nickel transport system substrate-binding protein